MAPKKKFQFNPQFVAWVQLSLRLGQVGSTTGHHQGAKHIGAIMPLNRPGHVPRALI